MRYHLKTKYILYIISIMSSSLEKLENLEKQYQEANHQILSNWLKRPTSGLTPTLGTLGFLRR